MNDVASDFQALILNRYRDIRENREHSQKILNRLETELSSLQMSQYPGVLCVAACGSYARMEASTSSDLDFLIVCDKEGDGDTLRKRLHEILKDMGLPLPNDRGVFATDGAKSKILDTAGSTEETYADLSRRLLLLLESRPLLNKIEYDKIIDDIVAQYASDVRADPRKNYVYLLNDLIRYFRTICVNYQHSMDSEWGKWPIRNIKLRHSRVLMYFSLIACLGHLSTYTEDDKDDLLMRHIGLTPLERIFEIYKKSGDSNYFRFIGAYDLFLRFLSDDEARNELKELDYDERYDNRDFATLKTNSDALAAEISRFIFARRGQWSDRFFEYLFI